MKEYPGGGGLHGIDLEVPRGAIYGLVGPNGAGKTTLLSILSGLRRQTTGEVRFGVDRRRMAVCPDVPQFEPWLTAREVVQLAGNLIGVDTPAERASELLGDAGLGDVAGRRVGGFSRGMTQRLALAATMVGGPELVLLDEPVSTLDPLGRYETLEQIQRLSAHATVVFSSHILADVQRICDTVGVLVAGRLRFQGPLETLLAQHVRPRWRVRVVGANDDWVAGLRREPWVTHAGWARTGELEIEAVSADAGERGIPAAVSAAGLRLAAMEPAGADLEAAFLEMTADGSEP